MRQLLIAISLLITTGATQAQNRSGELQIGYFAPYVVNMGATVGYSIDLKKWEKTAVKKRNKVNCLQLLTQISYFGQINTSNNILLNPELSYKWSKQGKRVYLTSSIGTGYLFSIQKQEGAVNLSNGDIDYKNSVQQYFLPSLNLGFGVAPRKSIGFYFKASYGRKLSPKHADSGFLALSTGITIKIIHKQPNA